MAKRYQERYEVEWQELTPYAKRRQQDEKDGGPLYEHDRDRDEQNIVNVFKTLEAATTLAKRKVKSGVTVYGHATIQLQRYLPIEGTVHYDWEPIGEPEYIDAG